MSFVFTSEEAQPIAEAVKGFLQEQGCRIDIESAVHTEAPCRTTLIGKKSKVSLCVEAQKKPKCDVSVRDLAHWLQNQRMNCELYIATDEQANLTGSFLKQLDEDSIGLIIVDENGKLQIYREARNPALIVCPEPMLSYGSYKREVLECLDRFNAPNSILTTGNSRKDGLRDMCELVERITSELLRNAARKGLTQKDEVQLAKLDWHNSINYLAAPSAYTDAHVPLVDENLRIDLHSFKNARNLVDHHVRDRRQEARRQRQFAERMMMGPRLVAELVAITSRLRRRRTR